jgi:hypothetical protein
MGDQPVARPLPTRGITETQNKRTQTFVHSVELEPTIPALELAKTVHALDRLVTFMGETYPNTSICSLMFFAGIHSPKH